MAIDIREEVDLLSLIKQSIYVNVEDWERSHREGEFIAHLNTIPETEQSLTLHVLTSGQCVHGEWKITSVSVVQIDVIDGDSGVIESHSYRGLHRFNEYREAAETLFEIALESDEVFQRHLIETMQSYWEPLTPADYF